MSDEKVILPTLPENLELLFKEEEDIRVKSILYINSIESLKDHLLLIHDSLNILFDLTIHFRPESDDEKTVQPLGIRLFNSTVCSLKLLLSGYYQISVSIQRDILETGFLLDYFLSNPAKISEWKHSNSTERYREFKPANIRKALDNRDGFTNKKRKNIYQMMCEYATHPSINSTQLIAPDGYAKIGAFYDENYLKAVLEELTLRAPLSIIYYIRHFKNTPKEFIKPKIDFLNKLKKWFLKYRNVELADFDTESMKEWINQIEKQTAANL